MSKCCYRKKTISDKCKFDSNKKLGLERTMNRLENHLENPIQKIEKAVKTKAKLPHVSSPFRSISCFGVTKITTPIGLQKS